MSLMCDIFGHKYIWIIRNRFKTDSDIHYNYYDSYCRKFKVPFCKRCGKELRKSGGKRK